MSHFPWHEDANESNPQQIEPKSKYRLVHNPSRIFMDKMTFHGVIGQLVMEIETESEADHATLPAQLLVSCGNMIG